MRISDWSSDVCSSDLGSRGVGVAEESSLVVEGRQRERGEGVGAGRRLLGLRLAGPEARAIVAVEGDAAAALAQPLQQGKEPLTALGVENPEGDGREVDKVEAGEALGDRKSTRLNSRH